MSRLQMAIFLNEGFKSAASLEKMHFKYSYQATETIRFLICTEQKGLQYM